MINNFDDKEFQKDQGNYFEPFDKDKDFFKQWIDPYTTKRAKNKGSRNNQSVARIRQLL